MIQDSLNQALGALAIQQKIKQHEALGELKQLGDAPEGAMDAYEQNDPNLAQKMTEAQAQIDRRNQLLRRAGPLGKLVQGRIVTQGGYAGNTAADA